MVSGETPEKNSPLLRFCYTKRGSGSERDLPLPDMLLMETLFRGAKRPRRCLTGAGFTLIELMIVITILLTLLSIAAPMYRNSIVRAREAVLQDHLFTMRSLIDQYTLDKEEAPQALEDLVTEGYLRDIPVDPFTRANDTWVTVYEEDILMIPAQTAPGIVDIHSGSIQAALDGSSYNSW